MAVKNSFKQQCPSCEAMVPIRDTGLVGRKIDCPKCKYRFVVEEPAEEIEEEEEESSGPAKKTKPGKTDAAKKKPANGKAAKPAPKRRGEGDEDDEEDEESQPSKKKDGGSSAILIVGLGLGAVAIVALAIGAFFLFAGGDAPSKTTSPSLGGGSAANNTSDPAGVGVEVKKPDPPKDTKPVLTDATNLLPNDSQMVIHLPMERLLGNATFKKAAFMTPGSFNEASFQRTWGISPSDVSQVVMGLNPEKKTVFSVMRTSKPVKEAQIVAALKLKAEKPVGDLKYYLLEKPLDSLSTFLLKANELHDKSALHFLDGYTIVCADLEPMQQFLQEKGHPKRLSEGPTPPAEEPPANPKPGAPGVSGGPQRPGAPQPGGAPMPPGAAPAPGRPPAPGAAPAPGQPPVPGRQPGTAPGQPPVRPGGGAGGFKPPSTFPPGMTPPGSAGSNSNSAEASSSYLTIDPHLKGVLDQVEKIDKRDGQVLLVSIAWKSSLLTVDNIKKQLMAEKSDVSKVTDFLIQAGLDKIQSDIKALGIGLTELTESKFSETRALSTKDVKIVPEKQKEVADKLEKLFALANLDMLDKNAAAKSNIPGQPGGNGFPQPGQGGFNPPRPGFPPGGPGGQPGANGEDQPEEKGKDGDYLIWTADKVVAVGINQNLKKERYQSLARMLEEACKKFRADADMCDNHSRIHELAAATQEFVKKEGRFPRGTLPRATNDDRVIDWRPDQRLSWMVELLPYVANGEFGELRNRIKGTHSWDDPPVNLYAGTTVIPQFLTPLPADKRQGYYIQYPGLKDRPLAATHFVGIAGVGLDAADYRPGDAATDKLRGIFGYDRTTKPEDIKDGLSQTILLIQVPPEPKSPWIAGGGGTVRGVSTDRDCVQPFVCAEHDGKRGTFAIMADGKVRFIPATIDPKLFQAMCTIAGGEKIRDIDAVAQEVPVPEDSEQPELKAEQPAPPVPPVQDTKGGQGQDLKNLQGTWSLIGGEAQGKPIPAELARQLGAQAEFIGDKYVLTMGQEKEGGTLTLDETKTPKAIDARITEGKDKGKSQLGIYSLSGDELKLCFAHPDKPRPSGFSTQPTSAEQVFVFKRAKR